MPYDYPLHRAILNATTWLIKYYRLAEARLQARSRQSGTINRYLITFEVKSAHYWQNTGGCLARRQILYIVD